MQGTKNRGNRKLKRRPSIAWQKKGNVTHSDMKAEIGKAGFQVRLKVDGTIVFSFNIK